MKKHLILIFFLHFFIAALAQPESPALQKKKTDSLLAVLKQIPENGSVSNDTIRLNTIFALIKRVERDTLNYYLEKGLALCNGYSPVLADVENRNSTEIRDAMKKDGFIAYFIRAKARLLRIIGGYKQSNDDKIRYYLQSLAICEKSDNRPGVGTSYLFISFVYYNQSDFNKAIENLVKAQSIFRETGNADELSNTYLMMGEIYHRQNKLDEALENYSVALEIAKRSGNIFQCGVYYEYIGNCYIDMDNYPKAIENHFASLKMSEKLKDVKGVGDSYADIALIYFDMKDYKQSLINFQAALAKYKEFSSPELIASAYRDVAATNYKLHKYDVTLCYYDSALVTNQKEKDNYQVARTYFLMSDVYVSKHDEANALNSLNKTISLSKKYDYGELLRDSYQKLSAIYIKQGDYKKAYSYHVLFSQMKDSLVNSGDETADNVEAIHSKFNREKALQEAILAQKEAQIKQEKTQRYALYGGLSVFILFGLFMYNRYKVTQKQKHLIEKQKHLVEEKNKEIRDSINYAERIQRSFLATTEQLTANLQEHFVLFKPKDIVSGDFYWASSLSNGDFALVTADSTGHGVPGAIMSILNISSLEKAVGSGISEPSQILNYTRSTIIERLKKDGSKEGGKDGMDCSLISIMRDKQKMTWSGANNPVWVVRNGTLMELKPDKMPVGRHEKDTVAFTQHEFDLQTGDMIYTLTDGYADQFGGPKGKKFMYKQLKEKLAAISHMTTTEQKSSLLTTLNDWMKNSEQVDDITIIGIRV
jgi:serine phosphatase RsbU (regulator of sigma subunit)/Tfp pilus assembly protein PilF